MTSFSDRRIGICPNCGKTRYASRGDARHAAKQQPWAGRLNAYRCGPYWHLGHLPRAVVRGRADRNDLVRTETR